jgi:hypothetical protein
MNETRILITLLWMYIPRNWEFGSALSKRQNFGGVSTPPPPVRHWSEVKLYMTYTDKVLSRMVVDGVFKSNLMILFLF